MMMKKNKKSQKERKKHRKDQLELEDPEINRFKFKEKMRNKDRNIKKN